MISHSQAFTTLDLMVSTGVGDQLQREFEATFGGSLDVFSEGSNLEIFIWDEMTHRGNYSPMCSYHDSGRILNFEDLY